MPLEDYTEYYSGVIDLGQYQLDTVEEADKAMRELRDGLEVDVSFHLDQISIYSATYDDIEGYLPLRPDSLEEATYEAVDNAFYMKAILLKFPELQQDYDLDSIEGVIEEIEAAQEVIDGIRGKDPNKHQEWKREIVRHFREAQKYAQVV